MKRRSVRVEAATSLQGLIASELKIASAFFLSRRSSISASLDNGRPNTTERTRASARPVLVRGAEAASRATS